MVGCDILSHGKPPPFVQPCPVYRRMAVPATIGDLAMQTQPTYRRPCAVCGAPLTPWSPETLTAHEFKCYKASGKVPEYHKSRFEEVLKGEKRSEAAFRGVETRRRNGGKRAPRKNVKYTYRSF
jgi:hypothetical protein